ncbi:MAG: trypsin-like peptidase domain-containing protein [Lachnospiraceae bacterium]|nr:trypsin-like peptidase domain-containing protein [Lachnospiraceae bacterium]
MTEEYSKKVQKDQDGNEAETEKRGRGRSRRRKKGYGFFSPGQAAALCLGAVVLGGSLTGAYWKNASAAERNENTVMKVSAQSGDYGLALTGTQTAGQSSTSSLLQTVSTPGSSSVIGGMDVSQIAAEALPSVVSITNISVQEVRRFYDRFGRNGQGPGGILQETTSCGSGVIIAGTDDYLYMVTNYHVIEGANTLTVTFVDDAVYTAELCGADETMDLAVVKVPVAALSSDTLSQISVVSIGDSGNLRVGEQVVAIGNALGYGQSVTTGIVSALNRVIASGTDSSGNVVSSTYIQTDAAINPGNSGGALLNMSGQLIGINTAKTASTDVEGMGYAIPISNVLAAIQSLMT